jgi:cytochrome c
MKRSIALCAVFATASMTAATGAARAQSGDVAKGERAFNLQCKACHTLERGGANTAGPNLYGLMGRRSGTMQGYGYSEVMRRFGIEWTDKTLAEYLSDPKTSMPGTKMVFAGIRRQDQLDDVIAYLRQATR